MAFNYQKALQSGKSKQEIIDYLTQTRPDFDIEALRKGGLSDDKIISQISKKPQKEREDIITKESLKTGGILGKIGEFLGSEKLGRRIGYGLASLQSEQKELLAKLSPEQQGMLKTGGVSTKEAIGSAIQTGATLAMPLSRMPAGFAWKAIGQRAGITGVISAVTGAGKAISENKSSPEVVKQMATSGIIGAATSFGMDSVIKGLKWVLSPGRAEYTTAIPQDVYKQKQLRPKEVGEAMKTMESEEGLKTTITNTKNNIREFRKAISKDYEMQLNAIINKSKNEGFVRGGVIAKNELLKLTPHENNLLRVVNEMKPLESMPGRTDAAMNIKTLNNLYKELNYLYGKSSISSTAQGESVRELRELLKNKLVSHFGGKGGAFDTLLKDYSTKVNIYSAMDDLFKSYGNVKSTAQASRLLGKIFEENNWAYVDAISDFEKITGKNILDYAAAYRLKPWITPRSGVFSFDELFRIALTPLTSPRITGMAVGLQKPFEKATEKVASYGLRKYAIPLMVREIEVD